MAKNTLPTNFKDDILNASMNGKRRYNLIQNSDGTVSLEDASTYDQVGSEYGAGQVNAVNKAVNESADAGKIIDDVDDISAVTKEGYIAGALALKEVNNSLGGVQFGIDGEGNRCYLGADGSLVPFCLSDIKILWQNNGDEYFYPLTLSLELQGYSGVIVAFKGTADKNFKTYFYIPKGITQMCYVDVNSTSPSDAGGAFPKPVTTTENSITFDHTRFDSIYDTMVIPYEVYGIKADIV